MPTVTLAALEARILADLDGNTAFYTEPFLRRVINQGLRRLNNLVGFHQAQVPVPGFTSAGGYLYDTPDGILFPLSVWYEQRELQLTSLQDLGRKHRSWSTETSATDGVVRNWAPAGLSRFVINPADAYGGALLEVFGVAPITPLVDPGNTVDLNDEFVEILVDYGVSRGQLPVGGQPFAVASMAYQRMVANIKEHLLFQSMVFPKYWLLKQEEPGKGRAA